MMKAIALQEYGGPEVLNLTDLPDPKVGPDTVLIRVHAAGVNPVDWKVRAGYLDAAFPSFFPLVPGWDVAGVVEKVGPAVSEFGVGQEVVGYVRMDHVQGGTYAELVGAPVRCLAPKPASYSWEQAAGLPLAGLTARQALVRALNVSAGDVVLVHAAAGGVGSMAVQLGAVLGARVLGTASEANHDYVRQLGGEPLTYGDGLADRVRELVPEGIDAALDLVGGEALEVSAQVLKPSGRLASVTDAARVHELGGAYIFVRPDTNDLSTLSAQADIGRLTVEVAQTFPLAQAADAHRSGEQGHTRGKLVLSVA